MSKQNKQLRLKKIVKWVILLSFIYFIVRFILQIKLLTNLALPLTPLAVGQVFILVILCMGLIYAGYMLKKHVWALETLTLIAGLDLIISAVLYFQGGSSLPIVQLIYLGLVSFCFKYVRIK